MNNLLKMGIHMIYIATFSVIDDLNFEIQLL